VVLQILQIVAIIAGLLAAAWLAFYAIWWLTLSMVRIFPLIGRRHRHSRWTELNQTKTRDREP
jgi:hypothetical protein